VASQELRKTVTVLFADVTGSTALGERLDAETVRVVMSRYFEEMRAVVARHSGTVEKFIGDAVMAVFGIPTLHEDDALRAVRAAMEMRQALGKLNEDLQRQWDVRLQVRTGLNTGPVVAGDPASGQTLVTGDAVNVAARLQQAADPDEVLIGQETFRLVRDAITAEPVPALELKGKTEPVDAYRLLAVTPGAPAFARRLDSPLVGRGAELEALRNALDEADAERACRLVTVVGEAGVGKSRLVGELLAWAADGATILTGRCLPYGEGITFWPIAEALKGHAGITEQDPPEVARERIGRLLGPAEDAELQRDRVVAAMGLGEGMGEIQETFWAIRRLLETLAAEGPLILLVEDIHWAEPTLLDLLQYVAGFSTAHPILLLCTTRPELREDHPDWEGTTTTVALRPLTEYQCGELITNLLGRAELPNEVRDRITEAAEGNPLFVEEMVRMLIDDALLVRDDGHWRQAGDLSSVSVPGTIHALLAARLDRLHEEERAVIQRASVVGKVFYWGAVAALTPESERPAVSPGLQTLVRKEFVRPDRSTFAGEDAFRFSHILVRDAAYGSVPKRTRAELHEGFAGWLEAKASERIGEFQEILGYHFERAYLYRKELGSLDAYAEGLGRRAAEVLGESGRSAASRSDMGAAANLLGRAVALLEPSDPARLSLLPDLADARALTGDAPGLRSAIEEGIEAAAALDDRALKSRMTLRQALFEGQADPQASMEELVEGVETCLHVLAEERDEVGLAEAWFTLGQFRFWLGRLVDAEDALERCLVYADRRNLGRVRAEALTKLGWVMENGPIHVDRGLQRVQELMGRARGHRYAEADLLTVRAHLEAMVGRFDQARRDISRARSIFEDLGAPVAVARWISLATWFVESLAGDLGAAVRELRQGYEMLKGTQAAGMLASRTAALASALSENRQDDEAIRFADITDELAPKDDWEPQIWSRGARALVLSRRGEHEAAERVAREAVVIVARTEWLNRHANALMVLAEVLRSAGRTADALSVTHEALPLYERKGNAVAAERTRLLLEKLAAVDR
jgi:class 3 adenylate cyclase/tetratricopeptide (TPR) repeat protein